MSLSNSGFRKVPNQSFQKLHADTRLCKGARKHTLECSDNTLNLNSLPFRIVNIFMYNIAPRPGLILKRITTQSSNSSKRVIAVAVVAALEVNKGFHILPDRNFSTNAV